MTRRLALCGTEQSAVSVGTMMGHGKEVAVKAQEHLVEARVGALFRRRPALCGFTVWHSDELFVSEVTVNPAGRQVPAELAVEIMATLGELIDESPEAGALLHGRTFARAFH